MLAIWLYSYYVYVGRLCFELLRPHRTVEGIAFGGGRGLGVGLLVVFNVLWVMVGWCYWAVVLTSPGYAKHVSRALFIISYPYLMSYCIVCKGGTET